MELIVAFGDLLLKSLGKVSSPLLWREVGHTVPRQWLCSAGLREIALCFRKGWGGGTLDTASFKKQ